MATLTLLPFFKGLLFHPRGTVTERGRGRQIDVPPAGSLSEGLQKPGLGKQEPGARALSRSPTRVAGPTRAISAASQALWGASQC